MKARSQAKETKAAKAVAKRPPGGAVPKAARARGAAGKARKSPAGKAVVKVASKKVPDWRVKRWMQQVCRVFKRDREKSRIPVKDVVKVLGMTRQGLAKFEKCSKTGPLFATVLRATCTYLRRDFVIVISPKGAWLQRCGTVV